MIKRLTGGVCRSSWRDRCRHGGRSAAAAIASFDRYVALTERRIDNELAQPGPFLWIDGLSPARKEEFRKGLHEGGVIIDRLETRDGSKVLDFPDALMHHWVGLVFVPNVHVGDAVALMQDYDRHASIFAPNIAESKTLSRDDQRFRVALRFYVKRIISVTMDTENEAVFVRPGPDRAYSRIRSTRVTEIANAGTPQELAKPVGQENGFMWRLNTYWRFLERDGGTYIQCESITLSRDGRGVDHPPVVTGLPESHVLLERARRP